MRLKQFLLFLGIFTVCYILFFIVYDYIKSLIISKSEIKNARNKINTDSYRNFANFYGIQSTAVKDKIMQIYLDYEEKDYIISKEASFYNISNIEYVMITLYLEYLKLINKKVINLKNDTIKVPSLKEQEIVRKYSIYLLEKKSIETITEAFGNTAQKDLLFLNNSLLMPGVRLIDSVLYYYGDL